MRPANAADDDYFPTPVLRFESARFLISVAELAELNRAPLTMVPEIAFVGRSNAGKSTVINVLTGQRQLAHASKTPGRTQLLNFFELAERRESGEPMLRAYLVDLPGYGFAKVHEDKRERWDQLVGGYLATRRLLAGVVLVTDARRPLATADEQLLAWLTARDDAARLRVHILLNKADQIGRAERARVLAQTEHRADALPMLVSVQLFSALKREGLEELRETLSHVVEG